MEVTCGRGEKLYHGLTRDDFVTINVCGQVYEILKKTLARFPSTILGDEEKRKRYYVDFLNAYYFDDNRQLFESVLYFYQSKGVLVRPCNISMETYVERVRFFGVPEQFVKIMQQREGYIPPVEDESELMPTNPWQRKVWLLMDFPESSLLARVIGLFSVLIILLSIMAFCVETLPPYNHSSDPDHYACYHNRSAITNNTVCDNSYSASDVRIAEECIEIIEKVTAACFTIEYVVRFVVSPDKWIFFKSILNLIDLCAILPYFLLMAIADAGGMGASLGVVRVARLFRVLRVLKLSRHSMGLQVLGHTLKASLNELAMIFFTMCFSIIVFSSAMYYAEIEKGRTFQSIPDAFWYSLVTMTTVGYGDYFPLTLAGKLVGGACAINGVLIIAMVVPVIVTNFDFFYKRDKLNAARKRKQRLTSLSKARSEMDQQKT